MTIIQLVCEICTEEPAGIDFKHYCNECGYSMGDEGEDDLDFDGHQDYDDELNSINAVNGGPLY